MKFDRALSTILIVLLLVTGCGKTNGPEIAEDPVVQQLTPEQTQLNLESFDMVWTTIQEKYWDPDLGGLDWPAVRDELRPRVEEATLMSDARKVMIRMINRLGMSHFGIFPASVYEDAAAATGSGEKADPRNGSDGVTGMSVRVRQGQTLVVSVLPGSPADLAGVQPGWEVLVARETVLAERVEKMSTSLEGKSSKGLLLSLAMQNRLQGGVGETLPLVVRDGDGQEIALDLALMEEPGVTANFGNLPPVKVTHEARLLPGDIGYFHFNYFLGIMEVMPAYNQAMQDFADAEGIIIDLRGNPGGLGAMAMGMAGWFIEGKGHLLGIMSMRTGDIKFAINPRANSFQGPVALLIDEITASTAEIMAGGLQDLSRVRIFGQTSAGAALPSVIDKLPNGDGFQYAVANYVSQGGRQLEGLGVIPDVTIDGGRETLLAEGDPVLKAAVAWIDSL